jgi:hypothetical protein
VLLFLRICPFLIVHLRIIIHVFHSAGS